MKKTLRYVVSSIVAGFIMALAGFELVVMKSLDAYIAGAFLQGLALLLISYLGLDLYNRHLTEVFTSKKKGLCLLNIVICLCLNVASIIGFAYLLRVVTNHNIDYISTAIKMVEARITHVGEIAGKEWYMTLISGFICGLMIACATRIYRSNVHPVLRALAPVLTVGLYIILGFENLFTNVFYIAFAAIWNIGSVLNLLLILFGNVIGTYLFYLLTKFLSHKDN
ncbi:MAG: formate/nitrite transporter family protein [Bacilli bacterium]|nr:formate/nitrite transporter family protein [Bacilli bacterium]